MYSPSSGGPAPGQDQPLSRRRPGPMFQPREQRIDGSRLSPGKLEVCLLLRTVGVVARTEEMQGDVGLVADHPAVVSGCNVEDVPRAHLSDGAIVHCSCRPARDDDADMLDRAARGAACRTDMQRPSPARLVGRARPIVMPAIRTISNLPFSNVRTSSGCSNRFRITSIFQPFSSFEERIDEAISTG
jgi:hypothetical protein